MGLDELSPMSNSIGPGMTTPTPGMHGYPGAMAYSRAVPDRGGVAAQQPGRGETIQMGSRRATVLAVEPLLLGGAVGELHQLLW